MHKPLTEPLEAYGQQTGTGLMTGPRAIREKGFCAEAVGYRVVAYRAVAYRAAPEPCCRRCFACAAGAMLAHWLRYRGPATSPSFEIMLEVLSIVVIDGIRSTWDAGVGAPLSCSRSTISRSAWWGVCAWQEASRSARNSGQAWLRWTAADSGAMSRRGRL